MGTVPKGTLKPQNACWTHLHYTVGLKGQWFSAAFPPTRELRLLAHGVG